MSHKKSIIAILVFIACICIFVCVYNDYQRPKHEGHKTVLCIPVYGQSLALGEEAIRVTDFDSLRINYNGRIVTEDFDYKFGFYDDRRILQEFKELINRNKRSFELSIYGMAESLANQLGKDTLLCIFPDGRGMTGIEALTKGNDPYEKLISEIKIANHNAQKLGWDFNVPAICWMQGETDIIDYTNCNYKSLLKQFCTDINRDVKSITNQSEDIRIICYQSNVVSRALQFNPNNYNCLETIPPQSIVDLINEDSLFWASGPTYPYSFVNEALHIDGIGQKRIGNMFALSALRIIRGDKKNYGLLPLYVKAKDNTVIIHFNVPYPPLIFDTICVNRISNYGFNVINQKGNNILSNVSIDGNDVLLHCTESPIDCKARYAINGESMKSGYVHGPRGNLRDSQGNNCQAKILGKAYPLHNWCYQFDIQIK